MASSDVRMKLLIDTKARRVLFAEADKDFVDFLLYLLSLPLGTVVELLWEENMEGSLSNLYGSIENLKETYFLKKESKDLVFNSFSPSNNVTGIPLLLSCQESTDRKFYTCGNKCHNDYGYGAYRRKYVTDVENMTCPGCNKQKMTNVWYHVSPTAVSTSGTVHEGGGFVKGAVTYMIMDDLEVTPLSTISSITLLNKFKVKDMGVLEEKFVDVGVNEVLKLLKASMECKTVLTEVFFGKKRRRGT